VCVSGWKSSELDVRFAVVGDHVEFGGLAEALAVLIDDGREASCVLRMVSVRTAWKK
jgi:hypothetical protein